MEGMGVLDLFGVVRRLGDELRALGVEDVVLRVLGCPDDGVAFHVHVCIYGYIPPVKLPREFEGVPVEPFAMCKGMNPRSVGATCRHCHPGGDKAKPR